MTHDDYTKKVFETFEESDYSRFLELRDLTSGWMYAISRLMHDFNMEITVDNVLRAARHRYNKFADDSAMANAERGAYMDLSDAMGLGSSLMDRITTKVAERIRGDFVRRGFHFIEILKPVEYEGFYVFRKEAVSE